MAAKLPFGRLILFQSSRLPAISAAAAPTWQKARPFLGGGVLPVYLARGVSTSSGRKPVRVQAAAAHSSSSSAQPMEKVQVKRSNGEEVVFDVYTAGPVGAPGVVVIQEWWGVDYETKHHADTIAKKGYRVLIPDLYRGKVALEVAEAQHLLEGLDWPGAVKDIAASAKHLKAEGSAKVGVVGFCMGGALATAANVLVEEVDATAAFYGICPPGLADPASAKKPYQGHFGELDTFKGFADVSAAKALEAKLESAGVPQEVFIYPGVGHAFMNDSPEAIERRKKQGIPYHEPEVIALAWSRVSEFFGKYLS